jgi:hypothetical protein
MVREHRIATYRQERAEYEVSSDEERSHSGLVRRLGKAVYSQGYRGFESPPLRQYNRTLFNAPSLTLKRVTWVISFVIVALCLSSI